MIKNNFLRGLSLPVKPSELDQGKIKETRQLEHIIQQPLFQHSAPSHHNDVYRYYHSHLMLSEGETHLLRVK